MHPTFKRIRLVGRDGGEYNLSLQKDFGCLSPCVIGETDYTWNVSCHAFDFASKPYRRQVIRRVHNRFCLWRKVNEAPLLKVCAIEGYEKFHSGKSHQGNKSYYESDLLEAGSCERQLKELDSYFGKLYSNMDEQPRSCRNGSDTTEYHMEPSSQLEGEQTEVHVSSNLCKRKMMLDSLDNYFGELNAVQRSRKSIKLSLGEENSEEPPVQMSSSDVEGYHENTTIMESDGSEHITNIDHEIGQVSSDNENIKYSLTNDEASDFGTTNLLVAVNIAVFLFDIASPIRSSDIENLSLPLAFGAKINKLIIVGEWWRLLTPMFLHSGFLHVALGCWVLLTFGPQVCRGYGPFTFLLIYVLGGICGNLTSFIHTPELTVCGTGPVFAIIGAWLVYKTQNKQVITRELSESMFWKAVVATALSFFLSSFGRIDDWAHLGAAFSGIIFGYLTCPTLQLLDNALASKDSRKQEGFALEGRQADPCKSLLVFAVFMLIFSCLIFLYEPQLNLLEMDDFL